MTPWKTVVLKARGGPRELAWGIRRDALHQHVGAAPVCLYVIHYGCPSVLGLVHCKLRS